MLNIRKGIKKLMAHVMVLVLTAVSVGAGHPADIRADDAPAGYHYETASGASAIYSIVQFSVDGYMWHSCGHQRPGTNGNYILEKCEGFTMPGWEPERMAHLTELFDAYKDVTKEKLWDNLRYFLEALMPTCRECDIKLAIHQDDPPWDIFGLPRLLVDEPSIDRFLKMVDDPYNCLTLCSGSLSSNPKNNVADIVRKHCDRIAFAHIRNVKHFPNGDFSEASHRDCDGDTGILNIVKAYHDCGFTGYVRPDHGRHIWGEKCRPGYGLYDRALGIMYLLGCFDTLEKFDSK